MNIKPRTSHRNLSSKNKHLSLQKKGFFPAVSSVIGFLIVIAGCPLSNLSVSADTNQEKWAKQNASQFTKEDYFKRHLNDPIFKSDKYKNASKEQKIKFQKGAFLEKKYKTLRVDQFILLLKTTIGLTLTVSLAILFPYLRYLAWNKPERFWKTLNVVTWVFRKPFFMEEFNEPGLSEETLRYIWFFQIPLSYIARFCLNTAYFFGTHESGEKASIQHVTSLLENILYYIIFKSLLDIPNTWSHHIAMLFWPLITGPYLLINFFYKEYSTKIKLPFLFWWYQDNQLFEDPLEEVELLYIVNQSSLDIKLRGIIEHMFFEARRFPEKMAYLKDFITKVIYLSRSKKATGSIEKLPKKLDLSMYKNYSISIQKAIKQLYFRYRNGKKMSPILLVGPPGTGKSNLVRRFAAQVNASVAIVPLSGKTQKDIKGEEGSGTEPGKLGLFAEAMASAAAEGKDSIILFLEEGGQALAKDSAYQKEIEQFLLDLLEPSTTYIKNPALDGYKIPLPVIIIMTSNKPIKGALANRLKVIPVLKFEWKVKRRIIHENLHEYCKVVKLDPATLTKEDFKAIDAIIREMKKEDPESKKYPGLRQLILRVIKYLEEKKYKEYFQKFS